MLDIYLFKSNQNNGVQCPHTPKSHKCTDGRTDTHSGNTKWCSGYLWPGAYLLPWHLHDPGPHGPGMLQRRFRTIKIKQEMPCSVIVAKRRTNQLGSNQRVPTLLRLHGSFSHEPLTRFAKLPVAQAPGMPEMFSPPPTSTKTAS